MKKVFKSRSILYRQGVDLNKEGQFAEAEAFYHRALEIQKRIAGPDTYQVAKNHLEHIRYLRKQRGLCNCH